VLIVFLIFIHIDYDDLIQAIIGELLITYRYISRHIMFIKMCSRVPSWSTVFDQVSVDFANLGFVNLKRWIAINAFNVTVLIKCRFRFTLLTVLLINRYLNFIYCLIDWLYNSVYMMTTASFLFYFALMLNTCKQGTVKDLHAYI